MVNDTDRLASSASDGALLQRARLALQALQFEEEAARYRVACAELMEAIADAEGGNDALLKRWLLNRRDIAIPQNVLHSEKPSAVLRTQPVSTPVPSEETRASSAPLRTDSPTDMPAKVASPNSRPTSPTKSPWDGMLRSAEARRKGWTESQPAPTAQAAASSLDVVLSSLPESSPKKKKFRIFPSHIGVSLAVHGLMLVVFAWWVVVISQPEKQLSIVAGEADHQEVALETTLEQTTSELATSEDPEPAPISNFETLPIEVPHVAAIDGGVGPPAFNSHLTSTPSQWHGTGGVGTNLTAGAEFFGAKAAGNTFVFVVDCSPSMARDKAFDSAKAEILRSLSMLKPKQRFFILFFGAEIAPIQFTGQEPEPYMLRANPENLERTMQWIQRINIQKEGRHPIDAMRQAIEMDPDAIFLLFDGDTKVNNWTGRIRDMNRTDDLFSQDETKIPIHVVHFFREEFVADMKRLADENAGTYRFVARPRKGTNR